MATTAGPYLPVEQDAGSATETLQPPPHIKSEEKKKDPLYAAMFGTQIGSPAALPAHNGTPRLDTVGIDTLDEPVIDTLVRQFSKF